jgi:hypothetical protein
MHRWLIAIFALHFFLGVSAFSLGAAVLPAPAMVAATALQEAPAPTDDAAAPLVSPHGLMDELPDLPDTLPRTVAVHRQPVEPGRAIAYLEVRRPAVSPDLPLRPPQPACT